MLPLVKWSFAGLLMIASVVLGLFGAGAVVGSFFMGANPGPFPFALVTTVSGLVVFAAALGLMSWARRLSPVPTEVDLMIRMPKMGSGARWGLRILLMLVSVVLIYMGASTLLTLVFSLLGRDPADSTVVARVALGVGGIAQLAIGAAAMRGVSHLPRRGPR
jgi:hypothetical protein